jgi:HD superfamily phosphodiesterase
MVAGVTLPDSMLAMDATELVREVAPDLLFHHSMRVYVFGALQGKRRGLRYDPELLYIGAMFHDLGLVEEYRTAHDRFEIDGANAARDFLRLHDIPEDDVRIVWDAIALHTTPGIPEHKEPEVALVTAGVELDLLGIGYDDLTAAQRREVLVAFPRAGFKHRIIGAFDAGLEDRPETAFGNVHADVLERMLPGYVRPNFCDMILGSKFEE